MSVCFRPSKEQLGLALERRKEPLDVIVVDRAEKKPLGNCAALAGLHDKVRAVALTEIDFPTCLRRPQLPRVRPRHQHAAPAQVKVPRASERKIVPPGPTRFCSGKRGRADSGSLRSQHRLTVRTRWRNFGACRFRRPLRRGRLARLRLTRRAAVPAIPSVQFLRHV